MTCERRALLRVAVGEGTVKEAGANANMGVYERTVKRLKLLSAAVCEGTANGNAVQKQLCVWGMQKRMLTRATVCGPEKCGQ